MAKKPKAKAGAHAGHTHAAPKAGVSEDDLDACDIDFTKGEQTADEDLPAPAGGVVPDLAGSPDEDDVDACDVDFTAGDLTPDEDLPASAGGVAS